MASLMASRFRGFLPVIIDVETGGFNAETDALLEVAAVTLTMNEQGLVIPSQTHHYHIHPFPGANIEKASLEFTGIQIDHPFRLAVTEKEALENIFSAVRAAVQINQCNRAILVGHNVFFDQTFLKAAVNRTQIRNDPFHQFSCFDTVTLAGLAYGQTVLAKACGAASIPFNAGEAHSALYDAQQTATLFCKIVNKWKELGGWKQ